MAGRRTDPRVEGLDRVGEVVTEDVGVLLLSAGGNVAGKGELHLARNSGGLKLLSLPSSDAVTPGGADGQPVGSLRANDREVRKAGEEGLGGAEGDVGASLQGGGMGEQESAAVIWDKMW